jgi:hypothetical protein
VRPLGAGGMGAVYLGHDRMLDRPVALKFIAAIDPDPRARERFLEEARAIARLHHPNVASIYRIGTVEDRPYLAYELVDGDPDIGRRGSPRCAATSSSRAICAFLSAGKLRSAVKSAPSPLIPGSCPTATITASGAQVRSRCSTPRGSPSLPGASSGTASTGPSHSSPAITSSQVCTARTAGLVHTAVGAQSYQRRRSPSCRAARRPSSVRCRAASGNPGASSTACA